MGARRWRHTGRVQGVGFRPFVARVAKELGLRGFVVNDGAGVTIEAAGPEEALDALGDAVARSLPPPARIARTVEEQLPEGTGADWPELAIGPSLTGPPLDPAVLAPDAATCADCLAELFDPAAASRRARHALIGCAACGPRFTVLEALPFDRARTSLARFPLCDDCAREHKDPEDRRCHAETISCPACGPRVSLLAPDGSPIPAGDPVAEAARRLAEGQLLALKGVGGWHLACRADDPAAIARLRALKLEEPGRPFSLLVATPRAVWSLVALSRPAQAALEGPEAPIVLAPRREGAPVAEEVAPGLPRLGVQLPSTPVQHLIARDPVLRGAPLVLTSANGMGEPVLVDDAQAVALLGPGVDALLGDDRPVRRRIDDSVLLDLGPDEEPLLLRRGRGFVPQAIALPLDGPPGLALGSDLQAAVATVRGGEAVLSQPLGDLSTAAARAWFARAVKDHLALSGLEPRWIACDEQQDSCSTGLARALAKERGVPLLVVERHHAQAAAVLAEHGRATYALALGAGEIARTNLGHAMRMGRLRPFRHLPGDPRRAALALLLQALGPDAAAHAPVAAELLPDPTERAAALEEAATAPWTSSLSSLMDGVAALLGLAGSAAGQAALRLEGAALRLPSTAPSPLAAEAAPGAPPLTILPGPDELVELDPCDLVRWLIASRQLGAEQGELSAAFHASLAQGLVAALRLLATRIGVATVVLAGGAVNGTLLRALRKEGAAGGLEVLRPRRLPPGEAALAVGQAAVALARLSAGSPA